MKRKKKPPRKPTPREDNTTRWLEHRWKDDILQVWIPPVDHPEGELILEVDKFWLDKLYAQLALAKQQR